MNDSHEDLHTRTSKMITVTRICTPESTNWIQLQIIAHPSLQIENNYPGLHTRASNLTPITMLCKPEPTNWRQLRRFAQPSFKCSACYNDFLATGPKPPQDAYEELHVCISYDQEAYEEQPNKLFATPLISCLFPWFTTLMQTLRCCGRCATAAESCGLLSH